MNTILLVVALVLVIMDLVRSGGKALTAWAVLLLVLMHLLPLASSLPAR